MITQVAGRAGQGDRPGRVVVQSYQPEHYAIQFAARHDYTGFFNREIQIRHQFNYPPYSHIIRVLISGEREKELIQFAKNMVKWLKKRIENTDLLKKGLLDLGAYQAPIGRIKNKYRWQVLIRIRADWKFRDAYHRLTDELDGEFYNDSLTVALDFNPLSLL